MNQVQPQQCGQYPAYQTPQYNAVKIDIHQPAVNTPQQSNQMPSAYAMPEASAYEVPKTSVYQPAQQEASTNFNQPPAPVNMPAPVIPAPVVVPTTAPAPASAPVAEPVAPVASETPAVADANAPVNTPEVKPAQESLPAVDLTSFLQNLKGDNLDAQEKTLQDIYLMAENNPKQATELLHEDVINALLGIIEKDSTKLEGPSPKQLELREKIVNGTKVTPEEEAEANTLSPMDKAERNKQYSIFTTAVLQKLYAQEIEKEHKAVVPLTELPGIVGIVEQLKTNQNPMVRASAVEGLSYIQQPAYKQELNTIFSLAQKDQDPTVKSVADKAMEELNKLQ